MRYQDAERPSFPRTELEAIGLATRGFLPPVQPRSADVAAEIARFGPPSRGQVVLRWAVIGVLLGLIGLALVAPAPYAGHAPQPETSRD